jgi:DNA polymerase sigma
MVKIWIGKRKINQARSGFLSSYFWSLLTVYFLTRFSQYCKANPSSQLSSSSFIMPHFSWTDYGKSVLKASNIKNGFDDIVVDNDANRLFELLVDSEDSRSFHLDNSITAGQLFIAFFAFYGIDNSEFSFDFMKDEACLCEETAKLLTEYERKSNVSPRYQNKSKRRRMSNCSMVVIDPLENIQLGKGRRRGRVIPSIYRQFQIQNELRRSAYYFYKATTRCNTSSEFNVSYYNDIISSKILKTRVLKDQNRIA